MKPRYVIVQKCTCVGFTLRGPPSSVETQHLPRSALGAPLSKGPDALWVANRNSRLACSSAWSSLGHVPLRSSSSFLKPSLWVWETILLSSPLSSSHPSFSSEELSVFPPFLPYPTYCCLSVECRDFPLEVSHVLSYIHFPAITTSS